MSNIVEFPAWKTNGGYTTCRIIAEETGLTHKWIRKSIKINREYLENEDGIRVVNGDYVLTIEQAWLFAGELRNTSKVVPYKHKVNRDFIKRIRKIEAEVQKHTPGYNFLREALSGFFGKDIFVQ